MYNFGSIPFFASNNNLIEKTPSGIPSCISNPSISGEPVEGGTLSSSTGVWTNDPLRYDYKWYIDNYFFTDTETVSIDERFVGRSVKCIVVARNSNGTSSASTRSVLIT